jgi:outer membrane immunogenic protein
MPNSRLILSAAVAISTILGIGAASAADLPARTYTKAPATVDPVYSWTGFYIGANGGYGWKDPTATFTPNDPGGANLGPFIGQSPPISFNMSGALGGLQIGYNWQFNQNWVAGVETDLDGANIRGGGSATYAGTGGDPLNSTANERVNWFGTVRALLGFLPTNNFLVYGTGGFAYGNVQENASVVNPTATGFAAATGTCSSFSTCFAGTSSRTATGWTVGGGTEYAFMKNWSLKAEYLYVNLGSNSFTAPVSNASGPSSLNVSFSQTQFHVVRGGINYHF